MDSSSLLGARQLEDYPNDAAASTSWFQCPVMAYEALLAPYPLPPIPSLFIHSALANSEWYRKILQCLLSLADCGRKRCSRRWHPMPCLI